MKYTLTAFAVLFVGFAVASIWIDPYDLMVGGVIATLARGAADIVDEVTR